MLNININDATANVILRSKGELTRKPSYFGVGGFTIPVDIGENKKHYFIFDWVENRGDATILEDGTCEMDFTLEGLDLDFITESYDCDKDLNLLDIFRSIEKVRMDEIYYLWDRVLKDGSIKEDAGHFFDVVHFEIGVSYNENGEEKFETFKAPKRLLDSYNKKTDEEWKYVEDTLEESCIKEEAGLINPAS